MSTIFTRRTGRNVSLGVLVGLLASYVPFVSLVAPLIGGGVAGYLERAGTRRGALVGGIVGLAVAVVASILSLGVAVANLDVGTVGGVPVLGLLLAGALWTVVAAVGGALGAVVEADRAERAARVDAGDGESRPRAVPVFASVLAAVVTFVGVGLGVTALLDPYIWPSMVVGIPFGALAGVAVGVLSYHVLLTRSGRRGLGRTPGAS
ncbi:hypothetical protein SAMN04487947_3627 [Halogeometricum rufum]|uniref:DUF8147 domain-containing protein n=1 Tax=Halogeometricum rufum TaxID=553469 RepID=A0A1I6IRX7_9EURY|nr:DUF5518 domain-containing protein [Halogeometricum rufum]SFR69495.1 hypothetical protein SAMN04487947_3627 [Halogeometricum rufum]